MEEVKRQESVCEDCGQEEDAVVTAERLRPGTALRLWHWEWRLDRGRAWVLGGWARGIPLVSGRSSPLRRPKPSRQLLFLDSYWTTSDARACCPAVYTVLPATSHSVAAGYSFRSPSLRTSPAAGYHHQRYSLALAQSP